jgi:hypothetical protein
MLGSVRERRRLLSCSKARMKLSKAGVSLLVFGNLTPLRCLFLVTTIYGEEAINTTLNTLANKR